jgi:hypothetical protein
VKAAVLASVVLLAAVVGSSADAGFTPAWSYLPAPLRAQLAAESGGSLFLPARTPAFYRYRSGATVVHGTLTARFVNRVRVRAGVWRFTSDNFVWRAAPYAGACTAWQTVDRTLQLSGNKVYWSDGAGAAWRCVRDTRGRQVVISASSPTGLAAAGLASTVASGLDVGARTSVATVSLTVHPTSVHRGSTVLVSGVAGGCTSGDTVTIISHAFAATHSFAGVPAVFAQVGAAGRFSVKTRIPSTRRPGTYVLTARCGGGNLGVAAHLAVR